MAVATQPIPNRLTAKKIHADMQRAGASNYELGVLYRALLRRRLWKTQAEMAAFLGTTPTYVSRLVSFAEIPEAVVEAVGGADKITFRVANLLLCVIESLGSATVQARARRAKNLGYSAIDDVLEFIVADREPAPKNSVVKVRLSRDKETLRIDVPRLDRLIPHLPRLESVIATAIAVFEANLANDADAASLSRFEHVRKIVDDAQIHADVGLDKSEGAPL
ncbi:hypothetical protein [Paraburkholderia sp. WP4_3_2]|uniref:hypothetical protein n=1 Tax=Paraburkholderia sp. WP4_3_2 TaxID=2587162 RepID=UPI00160F9710|nr:hypothetical protein [Paraburkholderia sp. WP4_3_2]MBB3261279.1 hypothetical protein [Paraburkholderia sp. WP4_3_2]